MDGARSGGARSGRSSSREREMSDGPLVVALVIGELLNLGLSYGSKRGCVWHV